MSIPNADDYERIEDIEDVRRDDLVVSVSGNWYRAQADTTSVYHRLYCTIGEDCATDKGASFVFKQERFDYALRRKPQLPNKPGLWKDKYGGIWLYSTDTNTVQSVRHDNIWTTGCECFMLDSARVKAYAPFTPCKIVEES